MEVEATREKLSAGEALGPGRATGFATALFIALQFLDLITTLAVFSRGGVELNPIIRSLMPWTGRLLAIIFSKATMLSLVLLLNRRRRILQFANVLYLAVVAWNAVIFFALRPASFP